MWTSAIAEKLMNKIQNPFSYEPSSLHQSVRYSFFKIYGGLFIFFAVLGWWLITDLHKGYEEILYDRSHRVMQRSQIISQSFLAKIQAADYVLKDVIGRIQNEELVYPDHDRNRMQRMTMLLKEKSESAPDFFMVVFNADCVFTATSSGLHSGVKSKQELCEARKNHRGPGPLATYVPGEKSASGEPVLVLSRNLMSPLGEFRGGVFAVIELVKTQHWINLLDLSEGDSVALLDESQVLLARYPLLKDAINKRVPTPNAQAVFNEKASSATSSIQLDLDNRERLFGISKIEGYPFALAFGFDKTTVFKQWKQRVLELTAGFFVLLLLSFVAAKSYWTTLRQREKLRASEEHFRMLAENMADIVWRADDQLRFTYINAADQRVRGFPREEVIGTHVQENCTQQGKDILRVQSRKRIEIELTSNKGIALNFELPMLHKDYGEVWIEVSSVPIYGIDGNIIGYQAMGRDVSSRRQQENRLIQSHQELENLLQEAVEQKSILQEQAMHDPLTGLHNRRYLDVTLPREFARSKREGKQLAVIMLDLDHFKTVNDQYGHAAGDEVLKALAELLKKGARESDLICRYGGEEFVAIMPYMSAEQALARCESWRKQLEEISVIYGDFKISITLSAGIAIFPDHGDSASLLLGRADEMLYKSKQEGRNRIMVYAKK